MVRIWLLFRTVARVQPHQECLKQATNSTYHWLTFNPEERAPGFASKLHSTPRREPQGSPRTDIQPQPKGESLGPCPHSTPKESLWPCPEFTFDSEERTSGPFHSLTSTTTRPLPSSTGRSSAAGPESQRGYNVTISERSKYSYFIGTVLDIDGYFSMPIPTIKHSNRAVMEGSTCKSCRFQESAPPAITLQNIYTPKNP